MKDYHNFYLKYHVLLLANVSEEFRHNSSKNYLLCPSHYLNTPGLRWDAILKTKKIKTEIESFMKKVHKVEFLIFLIDIGTETINI